MKIDVVHKAVLVEDQSSSLIVLSLINRGVRFEDPSA